MTAEFVEQMAEEFGPDIAEQIVDLGAQKLGVKSKLKSIASQFGFGRSPTTHMGMSDRGPDSFGGAAILPGHEGFGQGGGGLLPMV
jgi:hypothetical protein